MANILHHWRVSSRVRFLCAAIGIVATGAAAGALALGDDWPGWRGPIGANVSGETGMPLIWSENRGVHFRADLPGEGASSPIVSGDSVFVTAQDGESLLLVRVSTIDGTIVWQKEVAQAATPRNAPPGEQLFHAEHNLASPTPATDGEIVVAAFGDGTLAGFDFDGNQLWKRNLRDDYGKLTFRHGFASSPVLYEDLVISTCLHQDLSDLADGIAPAYLVAHDKKSGQLRWRTLRAPLNQGEAAEVYGTPALRRNSAGEAELIVMGGGATNGYNPADGTLTWTYKHPKGSGPTVCCPTIAGGKMVGVDGKDSLFVLDLPDSFAVSAFDLTSKDQVWNMAQPPTTCSPVAWGDLLFMVSDDGTAICYDGLTGRRKWRRRLQGEYRASPVAAAGRVYFLNTEGLCTVIGVSTGYDRLAENELNAETQFLATPAISGGKIFIRGKNVLFALSKY